MHQPVFGGSDPVWAKCTWVANTWVAKYHCLYDCTYVYSFSHVWWPYLQPSNHTHHGGSCCFSGNGTRSICFKLPCVDDLKAYWGTSQVKGLIGGRAISYHSSRQARRLNARHRRRHTCPRQRPVWSPLAMAMETLRLETGSRCIKRKVWQFTVIKIYYLFDFTMLLLAPSNMDDRFDGAGKAAISKPLLAVWSAADHPD